MKNINTFIIEGSQTKVNGNKVEFDDEMKSLVGKLLGQFIQGKVDIKEKDNADLVKKAKELLYDLC